MGWLLSCFEYLQSEYKIDELHPPFQMWYVISESLLPKSVVSLELSDNSHNAVALETGLVARRFPHYGYTDSETTNRSGPFSAPCHWLAVMIVRGSCEVSKLFDAVEASGFLGKVDQTEFDGYVLSEP